ncbi:chloramphenicol acetyltransferase [Flavobacteriaceae bacterium TP-CH-4]|uniref:Chloramphenicol acetyltransferase n=1 Tax=Pelagihabitans pacificus TaxID=2696054 RepID=A0A967E722_9FLAO|nr:chloramphenicol acetyltransferase [Pelagihabitans pacificus]NHF60225.1 chloramphenicol acetyltransferase [Pelagihabitans pacificus]
MKSIHFTNPHRRKHFDFFNGMNHPHFNITANVDITQLLPYLKSNELPTSSSIVYLIAKAANDIPEFRWRIRDGEVVEHQSVQPSFTVPTEETDVFSFCTVAYTADARIFIENAQKQIAAMGTNPSFEDEEHRDDYLFLSAFPWVSFTGMQHAMHYHPCDSIPRISWGKFFEQDGKIWMPLSVQVHHAVVDGIHVGRYFQLMEQMAALPRNFLGAI